MNAMAEKLIRRQLPKLDHQTAFMKINNLVEQMDQNYENMLTPQNKNFDAAKAKLQKTQTLPDCKKNF